MGSISKNQNIKKHQKSYLNLFKDVHPTATEHLVTPVCMKQVATILQVSTDYGFLAYKIPEKYHRLTLQKNSATELPINNGKLFFHRSELVGCAMDELRTGLQISFTVNHSKVSNKYIAGKVQIHKPKLIKEESQYIVTPVCNSQEGRITTVDKDYGFIDYTVNEELRKLTLVKNGATTLP